MLLPPQHETLLLPMLTTRKNVNIIQNSSSGNNNNNTFTNLASTVVQPAKRGRRKMKVEQNDDHSGENNVNETASEIKDEINNNNITDCKAKENNGKDKV